MQASKRSEGRKMRQKVKAVGENGEERVRGEGGEEMDGPPHCCDRLKS